MALAKNSSSIPERLLVGEKAFGLLSVIGEFKSITYFIS